MVSSVRVEPVGNGPYYYLYIDGIDVSDKVSSAKIVLEPNSLPLLKLEVPFMRCEINGTDMIVKFFDKTCTSLQEAMDQFRSI